MPTNRVQGENTTPPDRCQMDKVPEMKSLHSRDFFFDNVSQAESLFRFDPWLAQNFSVVLNAHCLMSGIHAGGEYPGSTVREY